MNLQFTIKTIYSCHCLDYRDTILALKASCVSISTMSGASRFQSRTVLGKNDIFLVSIREDGIWNDLLCACLVFRPGGISLFSLLMATSSLSILYSITSLASFLLSASGLHFSLCMMLLTLDLFLWLFVTYLAALLYTASTLFISVCVYGSQTIVEYLCHKWPRMRSISHSWFITGFVTRVTRPVPLVEQELFILPQHMSSPLIYNGVRFTRSFIFYLVFCRSLFFLLWFFFWPLCSLSFELRILITL